MPEYTKICVNVQTVWMVFVLFPHCNPMSTWTYGYLFQFSYETRSYNLTNCKAVFLKRLKLAGVLHRFEIIDPIWNTCPDLK